MNITTNGFDMTRSLEAMGELLKTITAQTTGFQDKLLRASVTEKVADPVLGKNIDVEV